MADEIMVTEKMAALIQWANDKGQDEVRRLIRERLAMLKKECALKNGLPDSDGYKWDDALEPNDGGDQWKHGGDCNICRKLDYCNTQCRANKLLKRVSTHFLYECYLQDNPQEVMSEAANGLTPEQLVAQLGADNAKVGDASEQPVS